MDEYRSCLSIFISVYPAIYMYQVSIHLSAYIYNYISTYLYIHLSIFVFFSLRVSNYQDKNKLKMYTAMCWVAEGPHRFMKMFVALSIFFITFWGCSEKLTALLRDWVEVHMKRAHKFLCHFEQNKRENVKSCEKGIKCTLWAEINCGLSKEKRYRRLLQIERCCSRKLFC